jgi:nanoRNase/pAp phosphatase (c-di-AMP/oligoRNAs hydrolase)
MLLHWCTCANQVLQTKTTLSADLVKSRHSVSSVSAEKSLRLTISGSARSTITNDVRLRVTTVMDEAADRIGIGCSSAGTAHATHTMKQQQQQFVGWHCRAQLDWANRSMDSKCYCQAVVLPARVRRSHRRGPAA